MAITTRRPRELVLVGGGHSHVQVLRKLAMDPIPDTRLTVVLDIPVAVYSGMVPGFVAGQYQAHELEIDAVPLARRARARVVLAPAVGVDPRQRRILLQDRPPLAYDIACFDIGSTVAGLELPGIREHALPTRPIGRFVGRVAEVVERARAHRGPEPFRLLVVGGGAGGVELAFAFQQRLRAEGVEHVEVTLIHSGSRVLPGSPESLVRRVERHAAQRGIELLCCHHVASAEAREVVLDTGERHPCDALVWVTGAVGHRVFEGSGLDLETRGFVLTRPTLQVEGFDDLFAVGDCATLAEHPETPKAGVYAVRQGPFLADNLRAALSGGGLKAYRPQRDFLALLNLGDGTALGSKGGLSFEGAWVMRLKDWIDRRFMHRFQVLEPEGATTEAFRDTAQMAGAAPMLCGGCAAKVGQSVLERALGRLGPGAEDPTVRLGLAEPDDATAVETPRGEVVVASLDAFRAFTDDPYLVGRVAAVNASSDLLAKGVAPRWAQALVAVPQDLASEAAEELLVQILSGARSALQELGVTLVGGHTLTALELLVGFHVEGLAGDRLLAKAGLLPAQELVLTKGLGTGVIFHADMHGRARGPWLEAALASMLQSNAAAARVASELGATAATDITGFGLVGHLAEMTRASGTCAVVDVAALPALPGALELMALGERSTFHGENARARRGIVVAREAAAHPRFELLFDPQTSGGLLFGVPEGHGAGAVERLRREGHAHAAVIGRVIPPREDRAPLEVEVKVPARPRDPVAVEAPQISRPTAGTMIRSSSIRR